MILDLSIHLLDSVVKKGCSLAVVFAFESLLGQLGGQGRALSRRKAKLVVEGSQRVVELIDLSSVFSLSLLELLSILGELTLQSS